MRKDSDKLRLLLVEDDALTAQFTLERLRAEGLQCELEQVTCEADFRRALIQAPDVILSDSNVPSFDGMTALALARREVPQTPFIFVSANAATPVIDSALRAGAHAYVLKSELATLPQVIRQALASSGRPSSRQKDFQPVEELPTQTTASHLLERQAMLDRTLISHGDSSLAGLLKSRPPTPAALLVLGHEPTRNRYLKLLRNAHIEVDVAEHRGEALFKLEAEVHALLLTDETELIRRARQLTCGSASHIVFVAPAEAACSEALEAGANEVMPEEARGSHFWAQLTNMRRIVSFAASLQSAVTDSRILATLDELTRCGNRRFFDQQFPREVTRAARLGQPLSLVLADIDLFKAINDRHGHPIGDEVLAQFGERLTCKLRLGEDWVARIGGEEFAVVLPDTGRLQALAIAERLRERVFEEPFETSVGPIAVTASFGLSGLQPAGNANRLSHHLVRAADAALYASKRAGRNRVSEQGLLEETAAV